MIISCNIDVHKSPIEQGDSVEFIEPHASTSAAGNDVPFVSKAAPSAADSRA